MYFGVDYHPEQWVYPYDGTAEDPEARWLRDAQLMAECGVNVVRLGEFVWGLYEPEEGKYQFDWMLRCMNVMQTAGIKVVLATPTAAPPIWLSRQHRDILPRDVHSLPLHEGTRHAYCKNSDTYWEYCRRLLRAMAAAFGPHEQLLAWQIDNGIGAHGTEQSFNEETRKDWHAWLQAKYETIGRLNERLGLRFWGQVVTRFEDMPMPMAAPTVHNPALLLDWQRFSSDTCVAFIKMQADLLHELTPGIPVTSNIRPLARTFDHFDFGEVLDFVSMDSNATIKSRSAENAMEIDLLRSLKKENVRTPDGESGFWVMEQKAGQVNWQDVNSLVRPGVVRLFTHQLLSRGADGVLYFFWRQPRIGSEKFYGGVLTHDGRGDNRVFKEIRQIGEEVQRIAPALTGTRVVPQVAILFSHENDWALRFPMQPTKHFNLREHVQLFYNALHGRNIPVDFARPLDDLARYKLVIAPSLHLLAGAEADRLKLYVHNGGTLLATCNTGLVDEHNIATDTAYPHNLTDLFGLEVREFDVLSPGEDNHIIFKGNFPSTHAHPARLWCDLIEPKECEVIATYAKDFYAGSPAVTLNKFGMGNAAYVGCLSHQPFYLDLIQWLRGLAEIAPLFKVPDSVEVSLRQSASAKIYFCLNHQNTPVRITFYKPMHDLLSGKTLDGNHDLPAHGVLVLDESAVVT
jgi:beta-galactosidase